MALDGKALPTLLSKIDANLQSHGTICLIGSRATILLGQPARQTDDLVVWARASRVTLDDFRRAVEASGLGFDPKDKFPALPYIQVVHPGIVQVPGWDAGKREWFGEPEREVWSGEKLTVTVPPPRSIAASKLIRGDDRDLEDCLWLMAAHGIGAQDIMAAIKGLPREPREKAKVNLDILSLMKP
jgi:hypothetical protein